MDQERLDYDDDPIRPLPFTDPSEVGLVVAICAAAVLVLYVAISLHDG